MPASETERIANILTKNFGLAITATYNELPQGTAVELEPLELHSHEGFKIRVILGWRRVTSTFIPGKFSAVLIKSMGEVNQGGRILISEISRAISDAGGQINIHINNNRVEYVDSSDWPDLWKQFHLEVRSPFINTDSDLALSAERESLVVEWGGKMLSLVISLLPVEVVEEPPPDYSLEPGNDEGLMKLQISTRYERSRRNRAAGIAIHGTHCKVCGYNFEERFGDIGTGFILVHHLTPLSKLGGSYLLNPTTDLVPVCPNCHSMLHRKDPPYTVKELRSILEANRL